MTQQPHALEGVTDVGKEGKELDHSFEKRISWLMNVLSLVSRHCNPTGTTTISI